MKKKVPEKEKSEKKDEIDITYDRRTRLHFEYEDSLSALSNAYNNKVNVLEGILAGSCDEQRLVEADVLLNSLITRRMYCLLMLRREINDELEELEQMMQDNGFSMQFTKKEERQ